MKIVTVSSIMVCLLLGLCVEAECVATDSILGLATKVQLTLPSGNNTGLSNTSEGHSQ